MNLKTCIHVYNSFTIYNIITYAGPKNETIVEKCFIGLA
jgi:hypothetical protein